MTTAVPNAAPAAKSAPTRRVGSWTLGLVLIACGLCMLAYHFMPKFDYLLAAKLAPVILVALGAEVLICAALPQKRKYDFFSIFVCLVLCAAALCVSFIPVVWSYIGPQRDEVNIWLQQQAEQQLYQQLKGGPVSDARVVLYLTDAQVLEQVTEFDRLDGTEHIYVHVELTGTYADEAAFAAACRTVADAVQTLPVQVDSLTVSCEQPAVDGAAASHIQLVLDSPYKLDWSAEQLAAIVEQVHY